MVVVAVVIIIAVLAAAVVVEVMGLVEEFEVGLVVIVAEIDQVAVAVVRVVLLPQQLLPFLLL